MTGDAIMPGLAARWGLGMLLVVVVVVVDRLYLLPPPPPGESVWSSYQRPAGHAPHLEKAGKSKQLNVFILRVSKTLKLIN